VKKTHCHKTLDETLAAFRPRVAAFIARMAPFPHDVVDDLVQETLIKVARGWEKFEGRSALSTWIFKIAVNTLMDHRRNEKKTWEEASKNRVWDHETTGGGLLEAMERRQMSECVKRRLASLPRGFSAVLTMREIEGLKLQDIAVRTGESVTAVKTRLCRARKKLRSIIESECDLGTDRKGVVICEPKRPDIQKPDPAQNR
jgi:RNA polymerase sigma-70 factor (ECF subfamily)